MTRFHVLAALLSILLLVGCKSNEGPFQATYVEGLAKPEAVLENSTDIEIEVDFKGPSPATLRVQPRQKDKVALAPGHYTFVASAPNHPNITPYHGSQNFEENNRYSWIFYLQKR